MQYIKENKNSKPHLFIPKKYFSSQVHFPPMDMDITTTPMAIILAILILPATTLTMAIIHCNGKDDWPRRCSGHWTSLFTDHWS